ncbi:MAG: hypothetical protein IJ593_10640 [Lachnospiraceae bacterium]|nr:hypothetical protein [Lachnospiraceae bacterium]
MVSKQTKLEIAKQRVVDIVGWLINNYGGTSNKWISIIIKTKTYSDIYDVKTGYWGEGTAYLYDVLCDELKESGILNDR